VCLQCQRLPWGLSVFLLTWCFAFFSSPGVCTIGGGVAFEPHAAMKSLIAGIATMRLRYPFVKLILSGVGTSLCAIVFLSSVLDFERALWSSGYDLFWRLILALPIMQFAVPSGLHSLKLWNVCLSCRMWTRRTHQDAMSYPDTLWNGYCLHLPVL